MLVKPLLGAMAPMVSMAARNAAMRRTFFNAVRLQRPELEELRESDSLRFLAYTFSKRSDSKAQILQDLWVCFETGEQRGGYFVEFGATNGKTNSNTWLLEKKLGWRGILAEPNPVWHADLAANRDAVIEHRCVSSSSGQRVRFVTTDDVDPELSGIREFADGDHFKDVRAAASEIEVETISLNDLLAAHGAPAQIDYLSVDTEGSEFEILSHFDFDTYKVRLLSVEQNTKTEAKIEALLASRGFTRVFQEYSQWDGWYVSAGHGRSD